MTEYLPRHKETNAPLWKESKEGFLIKVDNAEILIPKPRKNAKKILIQLKGGPSFELPKEKWDKIKDCCRFLIGLKKRAGAAVIREMKMDDMNKGRFFISEKEVGFKWLTDSERNFV